MKFEISKQELLKCINTVLYAVYNRQQKTIYECIKITAAGGFIKFNSFDGSTAMETHTEGNIAEEGKCAVPARLLYEVVNKMPEGDVSFNVNGSVVDISCQSTKVNIQIMDAEQFPDFPDMEGEHFFIDKKVFKHLVNSTAFSVYTMTDKPIFTGILFEVKDGKINAVAIDGVRMAICSAETDIDKNVRVVIPAKAMKDITRILDDEGKIDMVMTNSVCFFLTDEFKLYTRLLEGNFMAYEKIIPTEFKTQITVDPVLLERSLSTVSIMAREDKTNPVRFNAADNVLSLYGRSEYGEANDSLNVQITGEPVTFVLNANYVMDVLHSIDSEYIRMNIESSLKPCVIKAYNGGDYLYMIVPINLRS